MSAQPQPGARAGTPLDDELFRGTRLILNNPEEVIAGMYRNLFETDPRLRSMFEHSLSGQYERFLSGIVHTLLSRARAGYFPRATIDYLENLARDHRKFGVEPSDYGSMVAAFSRSVHQVLTTTATGLPRECDQTDIAAADAISGAMSEIGGIMSRAGRIADASGDRPSWEARVLDVQRRTRDIASIRLHCTVPISYRAGQYLSVNNPMLQGVWRRLSPAVPPNPEGLLEFHIRIIEGGHASRSLVSTTRAGDMWTIGSPQGSMSLRDNDLLPDVPLPPNILLIAGSTGLAPLRAMLFEVADQPNPPDVHLVFAARSPGELYDLHTLVELEQNVDFLKLTTVVQQRDDAMFTWPSNLSSHPMAPIPALGRVDDYVVRSGAWRNRRVLIAGGPQMVANTRTALVNAGCDEAFISHDPM